MPNKVDRTGLHQTIRELFGGKLESEVEPGKEGEATRISIVWNQRQSFFANSKKRSCLLFRSVRSAL